MTAISFHRHTLLVAFVFLLLCGCRAKKYSYVYLKPYIGVYDTGARRELLVNDECNFTNIRFNVILPIDQYTEAAIIPLVDKAYALSLPDPTYRPLEKIKQLRIRTLNSYNAAYPPGSNMADTCVFAQNYSEPMSLDELLYQLNQQEEFAYKNLNYSGSTIAFSFYLQTAPAIAARQQFVIEFETVGGGHFADTSIVFNLKP